MKNERNNTQHNLHTIEPAAYAGTIFIYYLYVEFIYYFILEDA